MYRLKGFDSIQRFYRYIHEANAKGKGFLKADLDGVIREFWLFDDRISQGILPPTFKGLQSPTTFFTKLVKATIPPKPGS
jgi:hypothetical protein